MKEVSKQFFFCKKRTKKTFAPLRAGLARASPQRENQSFFCFFFRVPMIERAGARSESGRAIWFKKEDSFC
jgi:hypothetical protein